MLIVVDYGIICLLFVVKHNIYNDNLLYRHHDYHSHVMLLNNFA